MPMDRALAVCHPPSDVAFGERVRLVVSEDRWNLGSAEGMALLETLLRHTYPFATVRAWGIALDGGRRRTVRVDVYRDGYPSMTARAAAAARDGVPEPGYQTALYLDERPPEPASDESDTPATSMTT